MDLALLGKDVEVELFDLLKEHVSALEDAASVAGDTGEVEMFLGVSLDIGQRVQAITGRGGAARSTLVSGLKDVIGIGIGCTVFVQIAGDVDFPSPCDAAGRRA